MNTTMLIDQVHAQARELRPLRVLLSVLAAPLFVIAFAARAVCGVVWIGLAWCWAALVVGWRAGQRETR
jgi:hypothetical protein